MEIQKCRVRFLPFFLPRGAIANGSVTKSPSAGDVVGVVFVLDALKAGNARRRAGDMELRILEGLRGSVGGRKRAARKRKAKGKRKEGLPEDE